MPNYDGIAEDSDRMLLDINAYKQFINKDKYGIVIDCGANVGHFTNFIKEKANKVYAIEPATRNFELIQNGGNVRKRQLAIGGSNGKRILYQGKSWGGFSIVNIDTVAEEVDCQTLATFIRENQIKEVDLLKIDVEGAEKEIFGSEDFKEIAPIINRIVGEVHGIDIKSILELLNFTYTNKAEIFYCERIS